MGVQIRSLVAELLREYQETRRPLFREAAEEIARLQSMVDFSGTEEVIPLIVSINTIQKMTADNFRVGVIALRSASRAKRLVEARMTAVLLCRRMTRAKYITLAEQFKKTHPAILYLERKAIERERNDPAYADMVGHIASKCYRYTQDHPMETTLC